MAGELPPPKTFTDWIPLITAAKTAWSYSEYAHSWLHGAHQLVKTGTTTVADIEAMPDLLPEVWDATPLRVFSFLEMTGIRAKRDPKDIVREAVGKIDSLSHARCAASLSPHAAYSTLPELLRLTAGIARKKQWRIATHIAESEEEFEMFAARAAAECSTGSSATSATIPIAASVRPSNTLPATRCSAKICIAAHVNLLAHGDARLLGRHRVHVVHCPRSHAYFRHPPFLRERLANAGVNLCLGTDSLATMRKIGRQKPELNMFEEMRQLAASDKDISPAEILRMATINGARALGLSGQVGELSANCSADLIAIPDDKQSRRHLRDRSRPFRQRERRHD